MKETRAWSHGHVGQSEARLAGVTVQMVLLERAAERIEDPVPDVTLKLQIPLVVGALQPVLGVKRGFDEAPTLIDVAEPEERGEVFRERVVALVVELVP